MIRGNRVSALAGICVAVLLVAVACGSSSPSTLTRAPTPSASGASRSTASVGGPTPSASPTPTVSRTPGGLPIASSFPVVNSCDPKSVPNAIPARQEIVAADSLTLHVPILEYHRIVPSAEAGRSLPALVVPPDTFAAQMDALAGAGWHTITMATLANDLAAGVKPPVKTFVITIDDGWDDGYAYAFPILQQHGFVATYFVIAGRIDLPSFLTSDHLKALVAAGNEIGDHTMNHFNLTGGSVSTRQYQVNAAAARIAQVTGRWPESLAYPFGAENAQSVAAVAACGELRSAVIESYGPPRLPGARHTPGASGKPAASPAPKPADAPVPSETWTNRFTLQRIRVTPDTTPANLLGDFARYLRAG
jgi:peptidoglycan/xylan/chitin deacetylase (PgdA/CDA1 family)